MREPLRPAHAHEDPHDPIATGDDCYEDWMDDHHNDWDASDAIDAGGLVEIPENISESDLYYLMYTANQYGDYFASDDRDGDKSERTDRQGWMNYTGWPSKPRTKSHLDDNDNGYWHSHCTLCLPHFHLGDNNDDGELGNIASKCYVYSIRAVATLFKVFYETMNPPEPSEPPTLPYQPVQHQFDWPLILRLTDGSVCSIVKETKVIFPMYRDPMGVRRERTKVAR